MFEAAELGRKIDNAEYKQEVPKLREALLRAQARLRDCPFPVIIVFAGVDGAGKGETANLINAWMDPRGVATHAYDRPSDEELERPRHWRYWRDLPPSGKVGVFLSAWYSAPIVDRVYKDIDEETFEQRLQRIRIFERKLADGGALILKFWMHLGKKAQKKRLKSLEKDPANSWRVTKRDWKNYERYDRFIDAAETALHKTGTGQAPWTIVEGEDANYRELDVGYHVANAINHHADEMERGERRNAEEPPTQTLMGQELGLGLATVVSSLDLSQSLKKKEYQSQLELAQARMNGLFHQARDKGLSVVTVFEGSDAAGKGGAIRRLTAPLDARYYQVIPIAAPTDEERAHHYLWRFWRHIPRTGRFTVFDRSWYGRVLVERVEGFATEQEWMRSYGEITDFEEQLEESGILVVKFWLQVSADEQLARFKAREETPYKQYKLTDEDWRNREKWDEYEQAVNDMVERTSTRFAPWTLVEANDKRFARVKVLNTVCDRIEAALLERGADS